ncbi:hypothetical protein [Streptomyces cyanogenus]|uniref:Gram-positive cocci surface proteins LPxTG domain-containing protein n=1 Tax=Streptomyces cyanogenus TaxID=80860 RepID=A0ABX7TTZ6_STRCY|nr:hypothetical protein [Streptomyces cyanogenus]QTD98760.1 hypothetical protein S1361_15505 [Streptomyces cyanogenus]
MRLCTPPSPSLRLTAAVATAAVVPVLAPLSPDTASADTTTPPSCAAADARSFPLATRIRGGPASYEAGGGFGTWYIDLTNTTRRACAGVHPVVVLVDDKRSLRPDQPQLDFYDGSTPRPVAFETTDEQELVGVLDGTGFPGFTVPPGKTVSVRVRLALPSDTVAGEVTANAAVVQRRGQDGEWVGESNTYRFGIGREGEQEPREAEEVQETGGAQETPGAQEAGTAQRTEGVPTAPSGTTPDDASDTDAEDDSSLALAREAEDAGERARELARTGPDLAHGLLAALAALLGVAAGAFIVLRTRR